LKQVIEKTRLTLLAQLIGSCAVVAACGGGGGDGTVTAQSTTTDGTSSSATALGQVRPTAATGAALTADTSSTLPDADDGTPKVTTTFSSTTLNMPNPERGWYGFSSQYLNSYNQSSMVNLRDQQGIRLVNSLLDLSAYRSQALPQSFLDMIGTKFAMLRTNGMKAVLRPVYNYDSSGSDANLAMIKTHLTQLAPVFAANADVIAYFQAGFIGAWGEWHNSASGNDSSAGKAAVRDALFAAIPATHAVGFRYPKDFVNWYPTVITAAQAFDGSPQSRLGMHNDCFMSNDSDVGTYSNNSLTNNPQREYVKVSSEYAPYGGETCSGFSPMRMKCSDILSEGPAYHLTYLNSVFYAAFYQQWKSEGCYDQVTRSMGYRFQIDQVIHPTIATRNTAITFNIDMRNVGWSRIFSPRKMVVTLRNTTTGAVITGTGTTDMRMLPSQATASTRAPVKVAIPSSAAPGTYEVLVALPDAWTTTATDPRQSVRFANADNAAKGQAWDATNARFDVGSTLTIQ
jgi:hypothetical protein